MVRRFDLNEIMMTYESLPFEKRESYLHKVMKKLTKEPEEIQEELVPEIERFVEEATERVNYLYDGMQNDWY
ncbi:hypothetical protein V6R21_26195 [Limibacter armeniacum]|uniref:hypothetical protein n=1 Tax=Limibacter armeniacum TaxID=466084 RepID=UPI002FE557FA